MISVSIVIYAKIRIVSAYIQKAAQQKAVPRVSSQITNNSDRNQPSVAQQTADVQAPAQVVRNASAETAYNTDNIPQNSSIVNDNIYENSGCFDI